MKKLLLLPALLTVSLLAQTFNVSTTPELRTALTNAATNGEDDTIILADGTYKTTDDGQGTFIYLSNEDNNLTLIGSSSENVILSGGSQHQILNHNSTLDAPLKLQKLSFINGNNSTGSGGGVYTIASLEVIDCNFLYNSSSSDGGGFYSNSVVVRNSKLTYNSAISHGGGFYSNNLTTVVDSVFMNNSIDSSIGGGGGFYVNARSNSMIVTNSIFSNNYSGSTVGAGFYFSAAGYNNSSVTITNSTFNDNSGNGFASYSGSYSPITITNSTFTSNNSGGFYTSVSSYSPLVITNSIFNMNRDMYDGAGFKFSTSAISSPLTIMNSIFTNNHADSDGGGFYSTSPMSTIINSLFANNSDAIYLYQGEGHIIANNIFIDNNSSNIKGGGSSNISYLNNNYLDMSKVVVPNINSNNIFDGVNLGFIDEANGDYNLTGFSDLIDGGIENIPGLIYPETDLNGNSRISGVGVDIGPYEYFATDNPIIGNFTVSGVAKELSELTFNVDYILSGTRTLYRVEYDYSNDGTWTTSNTHTFNTAGTYTVNVKITDSEGEFSTTSKVVTIAALAFSDMTDEQKLIKAIDPVYYDAVVAIIETQKESANTSGYTMGEYDGKAYVQNNPSEFNLLTTTELNASIANAKQEVITNPASYGLVSQVESNASVAASYEAGKQYVLNNLASFDLVTLTEKLLAVSAAEETGRTYVVANPSEFALVTQAASNTAIATATTTATAAGLILGQSEIINQPADYNLTTLADMNTSVVAATASGVETGKQLVITTPADFGLNVVVPLQVADVNTLPVGWSMMAIPATITDMSIFSSVKVVWYFKDDVWRAYSPNAATTSALAVAGIATLTTLPANSSVWVEK